MPPPRDGRTTHLIRRFERMTTDVVQAPPAAPASPRPVARHMFGADGTLGAGQWGGARGRTGTGSAAAGESLHVALLEESHAAFSATIAHVGPSLLPQKRPRKASLPGPDGGAPTLSAPAPPPHTRLALGEPGTPPTIACSSLPTDRAPFRPHVPGGQRTGNWASKPDATHAGSTWSTHAPPPASAKGARPHTSGEHAGAQEGELMLTLESYAELDESLQCSHTMWVAFAERCIDRARTSKANGNLEDALVKYMMACNVFSRKFQELRDRNAIDNHPEYMRLRDDIDSIVVAELEVLQKSLQGLARSERRRSYAAASRRLSQLRLMEEVLAAGETAILVQDDTEGAIALPPSRPDSMSPMPRPLGRASTISSSTASTRPPSFSTRPMAEHRRMSIERHGQDVPAGAGEPTRNSMLQGIRLINKSRASNRTAVVISPDVPTIDRSESSYYAELAQPGRHEDRPSQDIAPSAYASTVPSRRGSTEREVVRSRRPSVDKRGPVGDGSEEAPRLPPKPPLHLFSAHPSGQHSGAANGALPLPSSGAMVASLRLGRIPAGDESLPGSPYGMSADPVLVDTSAVVPERRAQVHPPIPTLAPPPKPSAGPQRHTETPSGFSGRSRAGHPPPPPNLPLPSQPLPVVSPPFYGQPPSAVGSDPSLGGRVQSGGNPRNSGAYDQHLTIPVDATNIDEAAACISPGGQLRRISQISDSGTYGITGLGNFGNTCFMNSVIQCLVGTDPLTRFILRGEWKKRLIQSGGPHTEIAAEFAQLVEILWRGQFNSVSPARFRTAVANCSEQFAGNNQEDAHEFASFLLDTLHESFNHVNPRPPPEREMTPEETVHFEGLSDGNQALVEWKKCKKRNWSTITSIFQGQIQSRLTCMTCSHTSTTYHTFTELSVPIPTTANSSSSTSTGAASGSSGHGFSLLRRNKQQAPTASNLPVNIYQCLDAYSETEILDGDNMWMCPKCKAKRKATKRLLISRLPDVLTVHLKRFSTVGHFREKLEVDVQVPTQKLFMENYVVPGPHPSTFYNLYGVVNHYGCLSSGHYTASVYSKLRDQWNYFDDTKVTTINESQVATPAAYLLFFVQA